MLSVCVYVGGRIMEFKKGGARVGDIFSFI